MDAHTASSSSRSLARRRVSTAMRIISMASVSSFASLSMAWLFATADAEDTTLVVKTTDATDDTASVQAPPVTDAESNRFVCCHCRLQIPQTSNVYFMFDLRFCSNVCRVRHFDSTKLDGSPR